MATLNPAVEDYLKTVYSHTEWQPDAITPKVLADKLGVAPSSVTEMVKKMAAAGLVSHVPYGAIRLTDAGLERALGVVRRHRLIETWLVAEMGYSWDEVHDEAEVLEHAISDRLLEAIDVRMGHPPVDPHGDPIPQPDGSVARTQAMLLADAPVGHRGSIVRINDREPGVLRELDEAGVGPGTPITVTDASDGVITFTTPAGALDLPTRAARSIWIDA